MDVAIKATPTEAPNWPSAHLESRPLRPNGSTAVRLRPLVWQ